MNESTAPSKQANAQTYSAAEESRLILSLYREIGTANFWQGFLERFAKCAGFSAGLIASISVEGGEWKSAWSHQVDLAAIRAYITAGFGRGDDLIRLCATSPQGHFYSHGVHLTQHMNPETDSEVYREWISPQGIVDVAMAQLEAVGQWSTVITLYRHSPFETFSETQLLQFDCLIPHLRRALWLQGSLLRQQRLPEEVERWMSLIKIPVLLFDEQFICCEHNAAAREFLACQQALCIEDGRLMAADASASRQLSYELIHATRMATGDLKASDAQPPPVIQLELDGHPTSFVFIPVKSPADAPLSSAGVLVFIYQADTTWMPDFTTLQSVYGLTSAELALCSELARGRSLPDIASTQGKSRETLRSQLKQLFSKTGTGSQSELLLSLLTNPAFLASG